MVETQVVENTSGQGKGSAVPAEVLGKFNWGAFLLHWIWGIGNSTYITLVIFASILVSWIPIVGLFVPLGLCIWFGIKGNEWAWQNKKFPSVEAFHAYQKKWAIAGLILAIVGIVLGLIFALGVLSLGLSSAVQ